MADYTPLTILHFISPILIAPAALSLATKPSTNEPLPGIIPIIAQRVTPRRTLITLLLAAIGLTFFGDGAVFVAHAVITGKWNEIKGPAWAVYSLGNLVIWSGLALATIARDAYMRRGLVAAATLGMVLEIIILVFTALAIGKGQDRSAYNIIHLVLSTLRLLHFPVLLWALNTPTISFEPATPPSETDALLPTALGHSTAGSSTYGATTTSVTPSEGSNGESSNTKAKTEGGDKDKKKAPTGPLPPSDISWSEYFARFGRLVPYLWPSKSGKLQFLAVICLFILVLGRIVNVLVPSTLGKVVDALSSWSKPGTPKSPWPPVIFYIALKFCQGSGGIFSVLNSMLWVPLMQNTDREMQGMCFDHLLDLSLAFHTRRKTGEVLRILDRGSAINNIFQTLLMNVAPVVFDIAIATIYFYIAYGWVLASVIGLVMVSYITASITLTTWRTKIRRQMNERDIITRGIHTDVLMNWESVKYFTSEQRESTRYAKAIQEYQAVERKAVGSLNALNLVQSAIITSGLLAGSLIVAYRVTKGLASASEFVVFLTYLSQLYAPLNMLGMIYRTLNSGLVDAEKLLKLLDESREIVDKPDAKDLVLTDGVIEFKDVHFSYDGKVQAVDGISFTIEKGQSVALVGSSGSGKSSLLRLLYRFYDVTGGEILIDGQNIRDVTQKSLRSAIGIVPQDCTLWNDSIEFNIGYGKEGATPEEIRAAAEAARLDERISGFPEGYKTVVGERGVRLSGGEKQRVSLARTILKAPSILVLDEATSALDTENERFVQQSLNNLAKGRSSLIIAHRLSTLYNTDKIIVLRDGQVIEVGTHKELLSKPDGVFAGMWQAQIQTEMEEQDDSEDEETQHAKVITDDNYETKGSAPKSEERLSVIAEENKAGKVLQPADALTQDPKVDPFSVDIEATAESIAGRSSVTTGHTSYADALKEAIPDSLEDVGQVPMIPELVTGKSEEIAEEEEAQDSTPTPTTSAPAVELATSPDSKKEPRKRLGSIGGLVRSLSEQGKAKIKSVGSSPVTGNASLPVVEVQEPSAKKSKKNKKNKNK